MRHLILIAFFTSCISSWTFGQTTENEQFVLPATFLIGEHTEYYEELSFQHPEILLSVFQNDMDLAFERWAGMLVEMEHYAEEILFDLKGVKIYLHVYYNADGTISHLSFYPKPNSRNVPVEELNTFFKSFVKRYQMVVSSTKGYQHSGSAAFPTFFSKVGPESAQRNDR